MLGFLPHKIITGTLLHWAESHPMLRRPLQRCARDIKKILAENSYTARRAKLLKVIAEGAWTLEEISSSAEIPYTTTFRIVQRLCVEGKLVRKSAAKARQHGGDRKTYLYQIAEQE